MSELEALHSKVQQLRYQARAMYYDLDRLDACISRFYGSIQENHYGFHVDMCMELYGESRHIFQQLTGVYGDLADMVCKLADKYEVILQKGSNPADNF